MKEDMTVAQKLILISLMKRFPKKNSGCLLEIIRKNPGKGTNELASIIQSQAN